VNKLALLATAALVSLLLLVQPAMAQTTQPQAKEERTMTKETTQPLPPSGGLALGSLLLPATALLVGSGVLAYAVMQRRR